MKAILFVLSFFLLSYSATSQSTALSVSFKFIGIAEGYDHVCKTQVWADGELLGESPEVNESKGSTYTINVPFGEYALHIINLAYYEENWEEHTIENNYSIDCMWDEEHTFSKKSEKLFLLFDIDSQTYVSWKKMPKVPKAPKSK